MTSTNGNGVVTGARKTVAICETQPLTAAGLKAVLASSPDLEFSRELRSLVAAVEMVRSTPPNVLVLDKAFGAEAVREVLMTIRKDDQSTACVVWGVSMTEAEAVRFVQSGARGVLRKSTDLSSILICLHSVAGGATWMEQGWFREPSAAARRSRTALTPREQQVLELVGQGLKNREIARELGIRPGTVKVHLKHIFEKTGAAGRYSLALAGLAAS